MRPKKSWFDGVHAFDKIAHLARPRLRIRKAGINPTDAVQSSAGCALLGLSQLVHRARKD